MEDCTNDAELAVRKPERVFRPLDPGLRGEGGPEVKRDELEVEEAGQRAECFCKGFFEISDLHFVTVNYCKEVFVSASE
jgi:hypothetical protein